MKISELKKGQKVTIRCKHKTLLVDMEAHVAGVRAEVVLLELIRHDGQIVDFSSPHVQIITIYEEGLDKLQNSKKNRGWETVPCARRAKNKCESKPA